MVTEKCLLHKGHAACYDTIRPPKEASAEYLTVEWEYLAEELREKGVVEVEDTEELTKKNKNVCFATINMQSTYIPEAIESQAIRIESDIGEALQVLR